MLNLLPLVLTVFTAFSPVAAIPPLPPLGFRLPPPSRPDPALFPRQAPSQNTERITEITSWGATCTEWTFPITLEKDTPYTLSLDNYNITVLVELAARKVLKSATYQTSGRLCTPAKKHQRRDRKDTVQVLAHGATFNKQMWDFPYKKEKYSYVKAANEEGYATFAYDIIGFGNSSYPDGLLEAQTAVYVEQTHKILQGIRNTRQYGGKQWKNIIFTGFSIGGIIANSVAEKYPRDIDAILLHGISWDITWIYPAFLAGLQSSAKFIDPERWGHLSEMYQTQSSEESRVAACFWGRYEKEMAELDWETRDVDSLGAAVSFTYHLVRAPRFRGPVFLGIGDHDFTFCGGAECKDAPYGVYRNFPAASAHEVRVYPDTGHAVLYHEEAPNLIRDSHRFLKKHGL